ncbi:MAG: hypothetical protein UU23_C0001G0095 [Candidatus Curtissbacteria bacterium GW2011_GWA1_40_9]|uniref:Uncharacterized protein n=1 Tax=Candidatus Curtissbacteria bacterium GW2011_GWA1_40_9 TaxID=1618408 RepID=A0A0G0TU25_9BACT|nr:MAG: hypothetical protein UU23_C0001G0095 [Candidatus Curtissbacteria bacterium GW2011_GWA1_40_9]
MPLHKTISFPAIDCPSIRKFSLFFIIILLLLSGSSQLSPVNSLTPLEQAQQDYSFQATKYQEAKEKYENSKTNYLAYKTAVAKNEAFLKTQDYLIQINNVYITYLLLIDERSNLYDWGKGIYTKNDEHKILLDQIKALENLRVEAQNLKTLEETVPYAKKLKTQLEQNTLPAAYMFLVKTDLSQLLEARFDFSEHAARVENYVKDKIKENDRQLFLNWQSQVKTIVEQINPQLEKEKEGISKIPPNLTVDYDQKSYDFSTEKARESFNKTPEILKEILNFI